MNAPPDWLTRLRARNPESLRAVAEEHSGRLYRAARGMGLPAEQADDIVQEVFVTFLGSLDRFEGRSSPATWLFGILLRKVQEQRRASAKDGLHDELDESWAANFDPSGTWITPSVNPERALAGREFADAVKTCLDDLSPPQREVLVLRQFQELPASGVGKILDLTVTHVGVLLHRARLRMRQCLDALGWSTSR
ncbi:MAG: sigma-70 family RNA polymerase sigma factor [Acidobacteria bacterium]|nr:sigma-70 family RNA polymerase sigma factor [Acidobacteriota bacterium]